MESVPPVEGGSDNTNLAIIIPQYHYDPQTSKLIEYSDSKEYNQIVKHVSFKNGSYLITDAASKDIVECCPSIDQSDVHFIGNVQDFTNLSASVYQNNSISYVSY